MDLCTSILLKGLQFYHHTIQDVANGSPFKLASVTFDISLILLALSYFLAQLVVGSSYISSVESDISLASPNSFSGKWYSETKSKYVTATEVSLLLVHSENTDRRC